MRDVVNEAFYTGLVVGTVVGLLVAVLVFIGTR